MPGYGKINLEESQIKELKSLACDNGTYSDRVSTGLAFRLLQPAFRDHRDSITFEIDALESGISTTTKPATQFRKGRIAGLWHKHYYTSDVMLRNIGDRWGISEGRGNRDFDEMLSDIATKHGNNPDLWQKAVAHRFLLGALEERSAANRLTGHWIIFGKFEGKNYYLDIATHSEGRDSEKLYEKLRNSAAAEFGFLFSS